VFVKNLKSNIVKNKYNLFYFVPTDLPKQTVQAYTGNSKKTTKRPTSDEEESGNTFIYELCNEQL